MHPVLSSASPAAASDLLDERVLELAQAGLAETTATAYRSDWNRFVHWCDLHDETPLPASPATVARYLAAHADVLKPATLDRHLATIAKAHVVAGHPSPRADPAVALVRRGIRRQQGTAQQRATALSIDDVRAMVGATPDTLIGHRDRALLLLGYAGALRRSELVALDLDDLEAVEDGLVVNIRRSKTDQDAAGHRVGIARGRHLATCPVRAVQRWIEAAGLTEGPLLRSVDRHGNVGGALSDRSVNRVLKRLADAAGLPADAISGHSLRAGHATQAARAGVAELDIARQTRHRSVTVLRGYVREGQLFARNSSASLGL